MEKLPQEEKMIQQRPDASSEPDDFRVCLVFGHIDGPIGYSIFTIDSRVVGDHDERKLTPLIELPGEVYPRQSGVFVVGSRVYLVGGVIVPRLRSRKSLVLTDTVYVIDTAAPLPLRSVMQHSTRMNGGKRKPIVEYVNGLVYVMSTLPSRDTSFNEKNVFFESFNPNTDEWCPLPNPPFFKFENGHLMFDFCDIMVDYHAVFGSTIVYCSNSHVYAFHLETNIWETSLMPKEQCQWSDLLLRHGNVLLKDAVWGLWASISLSSSLSSYCLKPELGFVEREVDDLGNVVAPDPRLRWRVQHKLLRSKNGWFCIVTYGFDKESYNGGKPSILATVFRLVQKREDEFSLREVFPWPPRLMSPAAAAVPKPGKKRRKAAGEVPVFGAVDIRRTMFDVEVKQYFMEMPALAGCFLLGT